MALRFYWRTACIEPLDLCVAVDVRLDAESRGTKDNLDG